MFRKITKPSVPDPGAELADSADRHLLYQQAVQDVEAEIDFVEHTWSEQRKRPAILLREDFCGTANTACEWVIRCEDHHAIGIVIVVVEPAIVVDGGVGAGEIDGRGNQAGGSAVNV